MAWCALSRLDLDLVPLLHLLHLPVLVTQLCLSVVELLLRDLPKCIDFVLRGHSQTSHASPRIEQVLRTHSFELHVVSVLLLLVLLLLQRGDFLVELLNGRPLDVPSGRSILLLLLLDPQTRLDTRRGEPERERTNLLPPGLLLWSHYSGRG